MSLLHVEHISHRFHVRTALDDVSFDIERGEIVGVIGRSGAGKSTLLRCLCALERPQEGRILLDGADLTSLGERELIAARRRIGLVFQHFNLLESRTVAGNIALPLQIAGTPRKTQAQRVAELIELVGLSGQAGKRPSQLSGGQKQRVGIARALAAGPALLLCDEATSALDPATTTAILELLTDINRRLGLTIVLITHEMDVVRRFARRILVLDHGRLVEDGSIADLVRDGVENRQIATLLADIRPQLPPAWQQRLQAEPSPGSAPVVRLTIGPDNTDLPLLATLGSRFGIEATIVQGGVVDLAGASTADMILWLSGNVPPDAFTFLRQISQTMETLGHVPADR